MARRVAGRAITALAALFVLFALLAPSDLDLFAPEAFLRLPVEALLGVVLLVVLPQRARPVAALAGGALLGLLLVLKVLDIGFDLVLYRPFDPVLDWPLLRPAVEFLDVTAGRAGTIAAVVLAGLLVLAVVVLMALAVSRLGGVVSRHRLAATRAVAVLVVVWISLAVPGAEIASRDAVAFVHGHARQVRESWQDQRAFAVDAAVDAFRDTPGERLLTALRGKDVVLAFVESYGRDAVEDPRLSAGVREVLDAGTRRLAEAGYAARSGFLTSPTAGGGSWLAQATLLSGLWIDNQQRYDTLVAGDRLTLSGAFRRAGWRSVGVVPGITRAWPEGRFFGYERIYAAADLGYRGPRFGYATTPDQYTLAAFQRAERAAATGPVMATIPLVTSHAPWSPTPRPVGWDELGDGSVFHGTASGEDAPDAIFGRDPARVRADYGDSIGYSLNALVSYVIEHGDDDLVLVFLGDHQPAQVVTGADAGRDVPVTVVARDPAVLARISDWGWSEGLRPDPDAPVWPMNSFRDRFLTAFS
ncbi:hypothetical protein JOF41_000124 [Saccharothrix coeruleofusca]|uniref:sulfatase n=1 Tax=Saccharothrix coeruleofusca TaxID=33919 RepID=UPI0027DC60B5|nr:sulfatase [Saccharothrix coeruleofusca]MBP2333946.1 hypothetical protein [Saccharothrix coeruleofusca]